MALASQAGGDDVPGGAGGDDEAHAGNRSQRLQHDLRSLPPTEPEALLTEGGLLPERAVVGEPEEVGRGGPGRSARRVAAGRVVRSPLAPDVGEDGEVAEHRDLGGQHAKRRARRVLARPERVVNG